MERLVVLEEGQKRLEQKLDQKIGRVETEIQATNRRINDLRAEMNSKFELLTWMLGIFITLAIAILCFIVKTLWELIKKIDPSVKEQKRQRKEKE